MRQPLTRALRPVLLLVAMICGGPLQADDLPTPQGPVILTVSGHIAATNADGAAAFDRDMLLALGTRSFTTNTMWTDGPQAFAGVPLKTLMDRLGVTGGTLRTVALNDYAVEIPFSDVEEDAALLALDRNGTPMAVRDKGPVWLVYPYDLDARFRSETYHSRSVWQLHRIEVRR